MKTNKPICIIPARSGSKRIKNKNIIKVANKPIIIHSINLALKSKIFSKVVVTTDDLKIAKLAKRNGAIVPFLRRKSLAKPSISTKEVLIDCIKKINSINTKYHFCIYPSSILIKKLDLKKAFAKIKKENADVLIAVIDNRNFYRSLVQNGSKKIIKFKWTKYANKMGQRLPASFQDSGTFFIFKTKKYVLSKLIIPKNTIPYLVDKYKGIDLNSKDDLKFLKVAFRTFN